MLVVSHILVVNRMLVLSRMSPLTHYVSINLLYYHDITVDNAHPRVYSAALSYSMNRYSPPTVPALLLKENHTYLMLTASRSVPTSPSSKLKIKLTFKKFIFNLSGLNFIIIEESLVQSHRRTTDPLSSHI